MHTAETEARILRSIERKAKDVLGGQFGFRRGKGTRDAIGMQKIILKGKFRHRRGIVCVLHRPCNMDQINVDPKRNWYRWARKNTDQEIVHGSEC